MSASLKSLAAKTALLLVAAALLRPETAGTASAQDAAFSDIQGHWARQTIQWAAARGIADGYETGRFEPDRKVSEPEFLAMLIRTFPSGAEAMVPASASSSWYEPYYSYAEKNHWMVVNSTDASRYNRGNVAQLMASTQGRLLSLAEAVRYLLDQGLSQGKYAATVEGYASQEPLTRAEAVQFLRNAQDKGLALQAAPDTPAGLNDELQVGSVSLGDTEAYVQSVLGTPDRKDASLYDFEWHVYNKDPQHYTLVGMRDGKVAGLFTSGSNWMAPGNVTPSDTKAQIADKWGSPVSRLLNGNTWISVPNNAYIQMFDRGNAYVTLYYDSLDGGRIIGMRAVAKEVKERSLPSGEASDAALREAFEREILDLANAERVKRGLALLGWSDAAAAVAREHSDDMRDNGYFAHTDPAGRQPWDRAESAGLSYSLFAENIAAGQPDAFYAHYAWLNSTTGHRENLLGDTTRLGAGVAFGGEMNIYYTQNFFTP